MGKLCAIFYALVVKKLGVVDFHRDMRMYVVDCYALHKCVKYEEIAATYFCDNQLTGLLKRVHRSQIVFQIF